MPVILDAWGAFIILVIALVFVGLFRILQVFKSRRNSPFDFERDYKDATYRPSYKNKRSRNSYENRKTDNNRNDERSAKYEKIFAHINKDKNQEDTEEGVYIGTSPNRKDVFIPSDAKHVFICGTTGSGKTVALSNFIKAGAEYNYPMLIVDGKGDTDVGSLLDIVGTICKRRKIYVINFNEPSYSDKYNPFKKYQYRCYQRYVNQYDQLE